MHVETTLVANMEMEASTMYVKVDMEADVVPVTEAYVSTVLEGTMAYSVLQ